MLWLPHPCCAGASEEESCVLTDRSIHPHQMDAQGQKAIPSDTLDLQSVTRTRKCLAVCAVSSQGQKQQAYQR